MTKCVVYRNVEPVHSNAMDRKVPEPRAAFVSDDHDNYPTLVAAGASVITEQTVVDNLEAGLLKQSR